MFGAFRFLLAMMVVTSHLIATPAVHDVGFYAVRAFFILSGYAITMGLNRAYDFDRARFWRNRVLRLAPGYFAICLLTFAAITLSPLEAAQFQPRWAIHATPIEIVENLTILPLAFGAPHFRFFEPGWSIAVEIFMYLALYGFAARSRRIALIALAIGVGFHLYAEATSVGFTLRYFSVPSALMSFAIGAVIYFEAIDPKAQSRPLLTAAIFLLWAMNVAAADTIMPATYAENAGYYLNTGLSAALILQLTRLKIPAFWRAADKFLGDISYPLFLSQWIAAFAAIETLGMSTTRGWSLFAATVPFLLALTFLIAWVQQLLVEPARDKIRKKPVAVPAE